MAYKTLLNSVEQLTENYKLFWKNNFHEALVLVKVSTSSSENPAEKKALGKIL